MSDKCPKCGAEHGTNCNPFNERSFSCGAFYDEEGKFFRSRPDCYETEIAALKAQLESFEEHHNIQVADLTERLEAWRADYEMRNRTHTQDEWWEYHRNLKFLGEI